MLRTFTLLAAVLLVAASWGVPAAAQTTRRTPTTQGTTGNAAAAIGGGIARGVQGFSAGVPELQQAQELRDTALRGEFVGAEARDQFIGASGTQSPQAGTGRNFRIDPLRQPGAQAGQRMPQGRLPEGRQPGTTLQPTLTLGFTAPVAPAANVQRNVAEVFRRVPNIRDNGSVAVRVENGVVILEGTVGTPHQRALASQLVALEPGVLKVDNRLTVSPAAGHVQ